MRAAVLVVLLVAGCVDVKFDDGDWRCGPAGECPHDLMCHADGVCRRAAQAAEVPGPDAAEVPATVTLTLNITGQGALTVDPPGVACGPGCSRHPLGETVALTPQPAAGARFVRLTNGCLTACSMVLVEDTHLGAAFEGGAVLAEHTVAVQGQFTSVSAAATAANGDVVLTGYILGDVDFGDGQVVHVMGLGERTIYLARFAPDGKLRWKKIFGDGWDNTAELRAISVDAKENVVVVGSFRGTIDFGTGPRTVDGGAVIATYASDGSPRYVKTWPHAFVTSVAPLSDGSLVVGGGFYGDSQFDALYTLHTEASSEDFFAQIGAGAQTFSWISKNGGRAAWFSDLAPDGAGGFVASGLFTDHVYFGGQVFSAERGAYIARYTPLGVHVWSTVLATSCVVSLRSRPGPQGSLYVAGAATCPFELGGQTLTPTGTMNAFVARFAADNTLAWARIYGGPVAVTVDHLAVAGNGYVTVHGMGFDFDLGGGNLPQVSYSYLASFDVVGGYRWSQPVPYPVTVSALAPGPGGTTYVAGTRFRQVGLEPVRDLTFQILAP